MFVPGAKEKMQSTLRSIGHRPSVRGGNGSLTFPQIEVARLLGSGWIMETAIPTKMKRGSGYPTCYKVDVGNLGLKIGIELEGRTHFGKRVAEDQKKDALLCQLGWSVYRVLNAKALSTVYNLHVSGHPSYFANGALAHNCHMALSPTWRKTLDRYPNARYIGATATPIRLDKKGLGKSTGGLFDSMVLGPSEEGVDSAG